MDIMEKLLASQQKPIKLFRGQEIEGEVVATSDKEITLDLGTKSEGIIPTRDISQDQLNSLKIGDKLKAFVIVSENESGQVVLGSHPSFPTSTKGRGVRWSKFTQAQNQKSKLSGKVLEVNKGGLIIEVGGTRGFLPTSQIGFELISKTAGGLEKLIGQTINVNVIEVSEDNNKLIFSQRGQVSEELLTRLKDFKKDQRISGKVAAILPFGLIVETNGVEGLIFIADVSWEKVEDLSSFSVGQEIEASVLGVDQDFGRLNLSLKLLSEDPFTKLASNFQADEVVKGEVISISDNGIIIRLDGGVEGLIPTLKMDPDESYEAGKSLTLLVDSVDTQRRRINLAPFVTSTEGLIYK